MDIKVICTCGEVLKAKTSQPYGFSMNITTEFCGKCKKENQEVGYNKATKEKIGETFVSLKGRLVDIGRILEDMDGTIEEVQ